MKKENNNNKKNRWGYCFILCLALTLSKYQSPAVPILSTLGTFFLFINQNREIYTVEGYILMRYILLLSLFHFSYEKYGA